MSIALPVSEESTSLDQTTGDIVINITRDGNVFVSYYAFLDRTSENNWGEEQRMLKFITETINLLSKSPYDYNVTEYSYIEQPYCGKYEIVTTTKLRNYSYGEVTGERTFKCVK